MFYLRQEVLSLPASTFPILRLQGAVYHHTQSIHLQLRLLLHTECFCSNSPLVRPTHAVTTALLYQTASLQEPCMDQVLGHLHEITKVLACKTSKIKANTQPTYL